MTAAETITELSKMGVSVVSTAPGRIRLTVQAGNVPSEAVALARDHKPELIELLTKNCRPHNKPQNYIDAPDPSRPGWIRSTCSICGCLVGYRPVNMKNKVDKKVNKELGYYNDQGNDNTEDRQCY